MRIAIEVKRDAALRAGRDIYGISIVEVPASDFSAEEREELTYTRNRPEADCDLSQGVRDFGSPVDSQVTSPSEATPGAIHEEIAARITARRNQEEEAEREKEERAARREAGLVADLALPVDKRVQNTWGTWEVDHYPTDDGRFSAWAEEAQAEADRRNERDKKKKEAKEAEEAARRAAEQTEIEAWIRYRGSDRLRMILDEDLLDDSMAVYRDERLAVELPGWSWNEGGKGRYIRNPSLSSIQALRDARKDIGGLVEDLKLGYLYFEGGWDEDFQEEIEPHGYPVLRGSYLGRQVCRRIEE